MFLGMSLIFVALVCGFSLRTAAQLMSKMRRHASILNAQVEIHSRRDNLDSERSADEESMAQGNSVADVPPEDWSLPTGRDRLAEDREIESLVREIFVDDWSASKAAAGELNSHYGMMREQLAATRRGLMRAPFLSGVAGIILIAASSGLGEEGLDYILLVLGMSLVSTLASQFMLARAKVASTDFRNVCEVLERELSKVGPNVGQRAMG